MNYETCCEQNDGSVDFSVPAKWTLHNKDSPERNGRTPQPGEYRWRLRFKLDTGDYADVIMGEEGMAAFEKLILQSRMDTALEKIGVCSGRRTRSQETNRRSPVETGKDSQAASESERADSPDQRSPGEDNR